MKIIIMGRFIEGRGFILNLTIFATLKFSYAKNN